MTKYYKAIATEKGFEGQILSDSRFFTTPRFNPETHIYSRRPPMTEDQFNEYVSKNFWQSYRIEEYN